MPGVVMTSATSAQGVAELVDALDARHAAFEASGEIIRRRRAGAIAWCERALQRRVGEAGLELLGGRSDAARAIARRIDEGMHGFEVVAELGDSVIDRLKSAEPTR